MPEELTKVDAKTAAEICARFELQSEGAKALLRPEIPAAEFLELLVAKEQFPDAVRFLAFALPKREAVWWACLCAKDGYGPERPPAASAALRAAAEWVVEPTEERRRAAMAAAEKADLGSPAGCAGLAAFFSGGSLAPPDVPPVAPADDLTPKAASGAVMLSAVGPEAAKAPEKFKQFLGLGRDIASGKNSWPRKG